MECMNFKQKVSGPLIGFADIRVTKWGVDLIGCPVFQKGDNQWVSMPSRKWDDNGEEKWVPIAKFLEKDHSTAFSKKALESVNRWRAQNDAPVQNTNQGVPF
jgi:hypothetical protein